jgi:hypothetical protein
MTREHPYSEGDRVAMDHKTIDGPHVEVEERQGTVVQVSSTQPHITWVTWDGGPSWQMIGTSHLRLVVSFDNVYDQVLDSMRTAAQDDPRGEADR